MVVRTFSMTEGRIQPPIGSGPKLISALALVTLATVLLFVNLGAMGLTDRDEGRNAEAGREMLETGDWISPTFNYEPRFAKPVFVYWLMSGSYHLFGVTEFAARLPSAVFGLGLVLLQYLFLSRCRDSHTAMFGSLMLLLNIEILGIGRMALTDSVLVFFTTLSLYGFWLGLHGSPKERRWGWCFYVGMALATLTKGPVGLLLPALTALLYVTLTGRWRLFLDRGFPAVGSIVTLLLAVPWYAAMLHLHGSSYTSSAQSNTIGRFLNPMEGHGGTPLFYIPVLLVGFFPWSGWLPFAWYRSFRDWQTARRAHKDVSQFPTLSPTPIERELDWFAAIWVAVMFAFFSLSSTRLPHYVAPLFPAAAILTASYWHRCLRDPTVRGCRAAIHTVTVIGSVLALTLAAVPPLYDRFAEKLVKEFPVATQVDLGPGPYLASTVLLIGMSLVAYLGLSESKRAAAFWAAGASLALMVLVVTVVAVPRINRYAIAPPQELATVAGLNLGSDDRLIVYGNTRPSAAFYAKRKIHFVSVGEEDTLRTLLNQTGRTLIILPARLRNRLPVQALDYPVLLQRFGYLLLANEPLIQVPAPPEPPPPEPLVIPGH